MRLLIRYGDLLAENWKFCPPLSHLTPSLDVNPFESVAELIICSTKIQKLSVSEDFVTL